MGSSEQRSSYKSRRSCSTQPPVPLLFRSRDHWMLHVRQTIFMWQNAVVFRAQRVVDVRSICQQDDVISIMKCKQFEISYECLVPLKDDLEWKLTYVGSAEDETYDQLLESVLVGPVNVGNYRFVLQEIKFPINFHPETSENGENVPSPLPDNLSDPAPLPPTEPEPPVESYGDGMEVGLFQWGHKVEECAYIMERLASVSFSSSLSLRYKAICIVAYGVPGIGKTQLRTQLAINVQIPVKYDGLGGKAVYIG
ncbi:hypothetical protein ACLOJK_013976 [Asimina triloba]